MLGPGSRLLLVTDTWHPQINGVVTVLEHLKEEIERTGVHVDVLDPLQFWTFPLPKYPEFRIALFSRRGVRKKIAEGNYDEVHILTYGPVAWYARAACVRLKKPFTMSFHNQFHLYAEVRFGAWARKLIEKLIYYFYAPATLTLGTTETARQQLLGFGLTNVEVWPLGVDSKFFTRGTCPKEFSKPVFAFFGRVAPEKNIEDFLKAELPGTKIVIGDGPDTERLRAQYPTVTFLGYQTGRTLIDWMCCADVLVMPSLTDTFGLVIVEALALGIPVAAHNAMGPRDIIENGVNGYIDDDIAVAAKKCLTISPERCRESAKKYAWDLSARRFLSLIAVSKSGESGS
ncbi:MAG: glycosyltransferase family 1 protein [Candidatus Kaiserbacteria bacterium]|nr:MAG: glycosyltransferase family 1 protein [Candidatus Kaiserbacteria bacterium]